jgi:hypothetical protein
MAQYEMRAGRMVPVHTESDDRIDQAREAIRATQVERANRHNQERQGK